MIQGITEINFPSYATLVSATVTLTEMGEQTIEATISVDRDATPDFSTDWALSFMGAKFVHTSKTPPAKKTNTKFNPEYTLTFYNDTIRELKRYYFAEMSSINDAKETIIADQYVASLSLNLNDFVDAFALVLKYYYGDSIKIQLNPDWVGAIEPTVITISYSKIWDVLTKLYETYGVDWRIEYADNKAIIKVGYEPAELTHLFDYGFNGGLMEVERQGQKNDIVNILLGRGGEKNLPYRYFKKQAEDSGGGGMESTFTPDPDWIPELQNIYFDRLRDINFRYYVQGWKDKNYAYDSNTGDIDDSGDHTAGTRRYAAGLHWAYDKGFADTKFFPVEYVKDDESIAKYGEIWGSRGNDDDIYPTIQKVQVDPYGRIDEIVAVSAEDSDDVASSVQIAATEANIGSASTTKVRVAKDTDVTLTVDGPEFYVDDGMVGVFECTPTMMASDMGGEWTQACVNTTYTVTLINTKTLISRSELANLPAGTYRYHVVGTGRHAFDGDVSVTLEINNAKVYMSTDTGSTTRWRDTFDIWIKNVWGTTKGVAEASSQYAQRVWKPILGDRTGNEAKVIFSSGLLSFSEDYEFVIVKTPEYDTSKFFVKRDRFGNVVGTYESHWKLTLAKNTAEKTATGDLIPNTRIKALAGDYYFFVGIDMPHQYVLWAEQLLNSVKQDDLKENSSDNTTWTVKLDKNRITEKVGDETLTIAEQLKPGARVNMRSKWFVSTPGAQESTYTARITSITYNFRQPTSDDVALKPEISVTLADKVTSQTSTVKYLASEIQTLHAQVGALSNIEQVVKELCDKLYLRKDGIEDTTYSPTYVESKFTSTNFKQGVVGGSEWGIYYVGQTSPSSVSAAATPAALSDDAPMALAETAEETTATAKSAVMEVDYLVVRKELTTGSLVINQIKAQGGTVIESAAAIEVNNVIENPDGYYCYFDQRQGSIANLFEVDDIGFCQRYTAENQDLKYYQRKVVAVATDHIVLSKTDVDGTGLPAKGDVIVHFGSYTNPRRQSVIIRDVVGGGYERMVDGLDTVGADGNEYWFVGTQDSVNNGNPRFFLGRRNGGYIEWINDTLNIKGKISVESTVGNQTLEAYFNSLAANYIDTAVGNAKDELQAQIDGAIESFFYDYNPTESNYPASEWTTDALKEQHANDTFTNISTGHSWRWVKDGETWKWVEITDTATVQALALAGQAKDTADGKRRVFLTTPTTPYDAGDIWVNATYTGVFNNDIARCSTSRATGNFQIGDWVLASKYTDDTVANNALTEASKYAYLKTALGDASSINGGLALFSVVSAGQYNADLSTHIAWSGLNGAIPTGRDASGTEWNPSSTSTANKPAPISYWGGGDMVDLAEYYYWNTTTRTWVLKSGATAPSRVAQAVDRMDGTGYRAGGNLWWDKSGNLHADPLSFFVGANTVGNIMQMFTFNPGNNLVWADVVSATPNRPLTELIIGDGTNGIRLTYDSTNKALKITGVGDGNGSLYSEGWLSAKGPADGSSGSGSSSSGGLDTAAMWQALASADTSKKISNTHLSLYPLTINGTTYDPASASATISITASSLGALTAHQAIYDLTFSAGAFSAGTYSPKSAAKTINVPTHTSHLTNNSGFITASGTVTNAYFLYGLDERSLNPAPYESHTRNIYHTIKSNTADGLNDGGTYHDSLFITPWGDSSGGAAHNLGFTDNGNIWHRYGAAAWTAWKRLAFADDIAAYAPSLTGTGASGTWGISVSGNAASATKLQTARTIWGQGFDGTGNVSGSMSGVGTISTPIKGSYDIGSSASNFATCYANRFHPGASNNLWLLRPTDYNTIFATGEAGAQTEFARFDSSGKLGIGYAYPLNKLHVEGNATISSSATGAGGDAYIDLWRGTNASWRMLNSGGTLRFQCNYTTAVGSFFDALAMVYNTGNVGIGTTAPSYALDVTGSVRATGGFVGNADSATKLATPRTLWGQSFDGTANVSGSLTGVTSITASGSVTAANFLGAFLRGSTTNGCIVGDSENILGSGYEGATLYAYGNKPIYFFNNGGIRMTLASTYVGIGTTSPTAKLHVAGNGYFSGWLTAAAAASSSDMRLKKDIRERALTLGEMLAMRPVEFRWIGNGESSYGAIAQEVEGVCPSLVHTDCQGYKSLAYGNLGVALGLSLARLAKEAISRIDDLDKRVTKLEMQCQ